MSRLRSAWGWFRGGKRRPARTRVSPFRFRPAVELLAERVLPAVTATFANGVLTVIGDELDNSIAISRDAAGTLLVNGDGVVVPVQGGQANAGNTTLIRIFGMGGNDELIWSRSANLPGALINGGAGNDTITSGTGNDTLVGAAGNDIYLLDTDNAAGSDTIDESGGGIDTLDFSSTTTRAVSINLGNPAAQVVNAGLTLTLSAGNTIENVTGGDLGDTLTGNGLSNLILGSGGNDLLSGAADNDLILGNSGNDTLSGAAGDDVLAGGAGNDLVVGNGGNDTFIWNAGDGNDFIDGVTNDGLTGSDRLVFNGSDAAEKFDLSADGVANVVTRSVDNVRLDLVDVEIVTVNALGGADTITVNDLTGTAVIAVNLNLSGTIGDTAGDGQADSVIVNGTNGADVIPVIGRFFAQNGLVAIDGGPGGAGNLPYGLLINSTEWPIDTLTVNALGRNDTVNTSDMSATGTSQPVRLIVNGGAGNDVLVGGRAIETFVWNPGDGSDIVNGGGDGDTMIVNGSDLAERFVLAANGNRARVTRDLDGGSVDIGGVDAITVIALGGADFITVNDLTGTGVSQINLDLAAAVGSILGDNQADTVIVNGRNAADVIPIAGAFITGNSGGVLINGGFADGSGLPYFIAIRATDGASDTLTVNALGGNDTVDASNLAAGQIGMIVNGGAGNDTLTGSQGGDTFVWNPGDGSDTINGQASLDALAFNGSDLAENFVVSRNGGHVLLTDDMGAVTMDLNTVELIALHARGGADTITVNDLTGAGVIILNVDLSGPAGGGDGQADSVVVNGTNGDDSIRVSSAGPTVVVGGLVPTIRIDGSDGTTDRLQINALGGNDAVDSTGLSAGLIGLTADLGDGQTPAPRVTGVTVNGGAAQRSLVTQIRIAFDQHVTLPANAADAFRLVRQSDGAAVLVRATVDDAGTGTVVTLTFIGGAVEGISLADGRYALNVLAGQVGSVNGALDGDGDGRSGGDFVLNGASATTPLFRLFGDANGDGTVNGLDLTAFRNAFGTVSTDAAYVPFLDSNGDGSINGLDLTMFRARFGTIV